MLELKSVYSGYSSAMVIKNINIDIKDSENIAFVGRNGTGKTTLLRTIVGLNKVMSGDIYLYGKNITKLKPYDRIRMGIGYTPQGRKLFPYLTVKENLLTAKDVFMYKKHTIFPNFYDYFDYILTLFPSLIGLLNKTAGSLSGGEQQLVSLARALLTSPKIFLLDEPFEGIQPSIVQLILKVLYEIKHRFRISFVIVEHRLKLIWELIDKVYVIDNGSILKEYEKSNTSIEEVLELISI